MHLSTYTKHEPRHATIWLIGLRGLPIACLSGSLFEDNREL